MFAARPRSRLKIQWNPWHAQLPHTRARWRQRGLLTRASLGFYNFRHAMCSGELFPIGEKTRGNSLAHSRNKSERKSRRGKNLHISQFAVRFSGRQLKSSWMCAVEAASSEMIFVQIEEKIGKRFMRKKKKNLLVWIEFCLRRKNFLISSSSSPGQRCEN